MAGTRILAGTPDRSRARGGLLWRQLVAHRVALLLFLPGLIYFIVFQYVPMLGVILAFKVYHPNEGMLGSPWVGLLNFNRFFGSYYATRIISNALILNLLSILIAFPMPIILALLLNEVRAQFFKRSVQTITYFPYFISAVVMVGIVKTLLSTDPTMGFVNHVRALLFGVPAIDFVSQPELFRPIFIGMGMWQGTGFGAIIYLASLAAVDPQLYEAAIIDGANRLQLVRHVSLPALAPTIVILLLLHISALLKNGAEAILAYYGPAIYATADVIETFVYRRGIAGDAGAPPDYAFATAVGLFQGLVGLILIILANRVARRITGHGLW